MLNNIKWIVKNGVECVDIQPEIDDETKNFFSLMRSYENNKKETEKKNKCKYCLCECSGYFCNSCGDIFESEKQNKNVDIFNFSQGVIYEYKN